MCKMDKNLKVGCDFSLVLKLRMLEGKGDIF